MAQTEFEHPYYPVILVRGYAGTQHEVEATVADPYNGFNIGATKIRQAWTGEIESHYFESPLVRLMKEYGYTDVYHDGAEMAAGQELSPKSVIVYRYYDRASRDLGAGIRDEIVDYARGLYVLIAKLAKRYEATAAKSARGFKVYLVAHSMGGLICRCFLQNDTLVDPAEKPQLLQARAMVDKVFTYATPHGGIDLRVIGNIPGLLSFNNADNFNREHMCRYLNLSPATTDVTSLDGKFDPDRFFCLVGTNHKDYDAANGIARTIVGPMSDGLVKIANAAVWGTAGNGGGAPVKRQAPRAYVYRSHSGHYGITNSEDGYQNLVRFLFGNVRVDGTLEIKQLTLPPAVEKERAKDKKIRASYHFESIVRVRGKLWDLHRRLLAEGSAVFRSYDEMFPKDGSAPRHPYLFSTFLAARERVKKGRPSLGFSIDLGVLVTQYEVDGFLFLDDHYEGGYIFRDKLNVEVIPPSKDGQEWRLRYGFDSSTPNRSTREVKPALSGGDLQFRIPVVKTSKPGISAELVLTARPWNV